MFDLVNNYSGTVVKFDDLTVDKYLGKGSFGVVYKYLKFQWNLICRGFWKGQAIAMKELNEGLITKHTIEDFMKEAATME